ncbi:hypothetical protein POSPLADRAFT_1063471 [Postia placenta MAD-698-R-SB12]|uniref:Uncharacterized protein n=1 Tax=Postia placenta MAD-698-R-SB12 TaxID=670580 RepID=A0A1X6MHC8_9APHY|nr:hypothetical protein POSPLADRAFT_1063471 [Postia placenta MAD-698-R-SB12]OSX55817.1 hypothetical protein POSPLADRAFT_1063471 [Postia placenta MAD-698-R-SB12]
MTRIAAKRLASILSSTHHPCPIRATPTQPPESRDARAQRWLCEEAVSCGFPFTMVDALHAESALYHTTILWFRVWAFGQGSALKAVFGPASMRGSTYRRNGGSTVRVWYGDRVLRNRVLSHDGCRACTVSHCEPLSGQGLPAQRLPAQSTMAPHDRSVRAALPPTIAGGEA